jgi:short-subunit dehydrogenase
MSKYFGRTVLVTGASSGIGQSIALLLMKKGYQVFGSTRYLDQLEDTQRYRSDPSSGGSIEMIGLDVCDDESAERAMAHILSKQPSIGVLINSAGLGIAGSVENTTVEEAKLQMETNFFGMHRMIRNVLPIMRKNQNGLIINIGSVMGFLSIPFQAMYCASKYAIEALTESLRMEVAPFGIHASLVEPGDTRTGFTESRLYTRASKIDTGPYYQSFTRSIRKMEQDEISGVPPEDVARIVYKIMQRRNPPIRKVVGSQYKMVYYLKRLLPSHLTEKVIRRLYT